MSSLLRAAAIVVAAEAAIATAGAWVVWRWLSSPTTDPYQLELQRRARRQGVA